MTASRDQGPDKLRVLFISYYIDDPSMPGFAPKYERLSERWEGDVFHLAPEDQELPAGDFTFRGCKYDHSKVLSRQWKYLLFCLRKAGELGPYDVIISYDPQICGLIGVLLKWRLKAKLVVEVNTDHFFQLPGSATGLGAKVAEWIKQSMLKLSFKRADAVKFVNNIFARKYRERLGMSDSHPLQEVFFSYIATQAFKPAAQSEDRDILMVGHPFVTKGADVLIKAFNRIAEDYPDVRLKIVGHCDNIQEYKDIVDDLSRVEFVPGIPHKEVVAHFQECLFYVLSSRSEGVPRVLIEAMACGKAVIGSRVGGVPDVIVDGETGLLFESENDRDLADKMRQLLDDSARRERLARAGLERSKTEFTPDVYANKYFEFMKRIV